MRQHAKSLPPATATRLATVSLILSLLAAFGGSACARPPAPPPPGPALACDARPALPDGRYRLEHFVLDGQRANPWRDRGQLDQRLKAAQSAGKLPQEVQAINREYDAASGKQADREVQLGQPRTPLRLDLEPNSVHVLRFTAMP